MRVLLAHNRYQQPGGEDAVFASLQSVLRQFGHEVVTYERDNDEIEGRWSGPRAAAGAIWSARTKAELRELIGRTRPHVAHFVNVFPLISPSAYGACREAGVPVVQELGNYRLICPSAVLFRDGHLCEDCVGRAVAWPGVRHACYRGSRSATAAVAAMLVTHRVRGTWRKDVDLFVALTGFARDKLVRGGLPEDRVDVRPNFLAMDPGGRVGTGAGALFVGRLVEEKGIRAMLAAARLWPGGRLTLVGDGPLRAWAEREAAASGGRVEVTGPLPSHEVIARMKSARLLLFPSEWYEGFPITLAEAMAVGLPIVCTEVGGLPEVVGAAGLLVPAGNPERLAAAWRLLEQDDARHRRLGEEGRRRYEAELSAAAAIERLLALYRRAGARPG